MTDLENRANRRRSGGGREPDRRSPRDRDRHDLGGAARRRPARRPGPSGVVAGAWGAIGSALAGIVVLSAIVLVAWLTDSQPSTSTWDAIGVAVQGWLLAHGAGLTVSIGVIGLMPLGVTIGVSYLLYRTGCQVARRADLRTPTDVLESAAALSVVYCVVATVLTTPASTGSVSVSAWQAGLGAAVLAFASAGFGMLRESGAGHRLIAASPGPARAVLRAVWAGLLMLVAAGAVTVVVAVLVGASDYTQLSKAVAPGILPGLALTLLGVLLLPNAVLAAVSVGAGPGFAVGTGTSVSLGGVTLGPVPAFPLLAGLPDGSRLPVAGWLTVLGPLLAGIVVGVILVRSLDEDDERGPLRAAAWSAVAGVGVGLAVAVLTGLGSGSLGSGRLTQLGASGWLVGLVVAAEVGVLAALSGAATRWALADGLIGARRAVQPESQADGDDATADEVRVTAEELQDEVDLEPQPQPASRATAPPVVDQATLEQLDTVRIDLDDVLDPMLYDELEEYRPPESRAS